MFGLTYTSQYCEENIWQLCSSMKKDSSKLLQRFPQLFSFDSLYVVFISNKTKQVPLWCQKLAKQPGYPVFWDYHVILISKSADGSNAFVFDFDTTLSFPCNFIEYYENAFHPEIKFPLEQNFRVLTASDYLKHFASDRSHMIQNGSWIAEPPKYPSISTNESTMNLFEFIEMEGFPEKGQIFNLQDLFKFFTN